MHISSEPVILERQMSSFGKIIYWYCEVLNMKLNIWLDIPSKHIEYPCVIVSVALGIFSE